MWEIHEGKDSMHIGFLYKFLDICLHSYYEPSSWKLSCGGNYSLYYEMIAATSSYIILFSYTKLVLNLLSSVTRFTHWSVDSICFGVQEKEESENKFLVFLFVY